MPARSERDIVRPVGYRLPVSPPVYGVRHLSASHQRAQRLVVEPESLVGKAATVYDVAKHAGVSIATVSMTFRRPHRVKDSTRDLVLASARALHYVPSASARGLADGRTGVLGLFSFDYLLPAEATVAADAGLSPGGPVTFVRDEPNEWCREFPLYVDEIQRGMELACWQHGYALMIGGPSRAGGTTVTDIAGRVDGLAVFPQTLPTDALERIAGRIPVVAVSEPPQDDRLSHITVDNRGGMRAVTDHLIRDHGRRDLLFVGGLNPAEGRARFAGFKDALRAAGLRVPRKPLVPRTRATPTGRAAVALPDDLPMPEAFVCATDDVALDVLDILAARGVRPPADVAVTGFDGVVAGRVARPALTTVRQPMVEMGQLVVDVLRDHIADPARPPDFRELAVQVVLRESCGCPARGPAWSCP
jgi:LacI family transcriptional regulator